MADHVELGEEELTAILHSRRFTQRAPVSSTQVTCGHHSTQHYKLQQERLCSPKPEPHMPHATAVGVEGCCRGGTMGVARWTPAACACCARALLLPLLLLLLLPPHCVPHMLG